VQSTLSSAVSFAGVGLHSAAEARLTVHPAAPDTGIVFRRIDAEGAGAVIPALWSRVVPAQLCTRIANDEGVGVHTVEHLMAALSGCGIHNARIDIDGPEVPILDGSAAPFVRGFLAAGRSLSDAPLTAIRVLETVEVSSGGGLARLEPAPALEMAFSIAFDDAAIGRQDLRLPLANGTFVHELSDSRTFCRLRDVEAMRAEGLALGGTFENALVIEGDRVLSPGGLRWQDEPVRHKMLDALGDLALAGAPLLARYTGERAGHALTAALLRRLFATPTAWERVVLGAADLDVLPGAGLHRAEVQALQAIA
jgi:UDP-3-O-[3-hydroxymyristoyl] N-acetylglucosamine deacetylase